MRSFRLHTSKDYQKETLVIVHQFVAELPGVNFSGLFKNQSRILELLEFQMNSLSVSERLKIYDELWPMFGSDSKRIVMQRLKEEQDLECLKILNWIKESHEPLNWQTRSDIDLSEILAILNSVQERKKGGPLSESDRAFVSVLGGGRALFEEYKKQPEANHILRMLDELDIGEF
ncbi:MAG: hypothetical protein JWM04_1391 [Verrucomicrobiales bacterium]|nr:hypothetical protein [Verrucomicrobiales bacterium]